MILTDTFIHVLMYTSEHNVYIYKTKLSTQQSYDIEFYYINI